MERFGIEPMDSFHPSSDLLFGYSYDPCAALLTFTLCMTMTITAGKRQLADDDGMLQFWQHFIGTTIVSAERSGWQTVRQRDSRRQAC